MTAIRGFLSIVLVLAAILGGVRHSFAQLTVTGGLTANDLAQLLAGPGITVSNAVITGSAQAAGSFNGSASNIGMNSGILLCTGPITVAPGPNNSGSAGMDNGQPGNSQLNALAGAATYNAFTLEFDFIPLSNTVEFDYVFGSEEYPEYVNSGFNDAFAFFISGPGIVGQQNMALIPGTGIPVTIDNLNAGANSQYYVNNTPGATVQYDAFTTVLTATAQVQACVSYHLKLMIADAGDGVWDSGVFLEEGSLTSNVIEITTTTATADSTAYENCSVATVTFTLSDPVSTDYTVSYNVTGTATNGTDYPLLPGTITIPANTLSATFTIDPFFDGMVEGQETILIDLQTSVCGSDTILIYVNDVSPVVLQAFGDTAFCGGTAMLWAQATGGAGNYTYTWSNGMTGDTIYVNPTATTTYTVTANDFCSSTVPEPSDDVTVTIDPTPMADAGPDIPYCAGDAVILTGSGGTTYEWFELPGYTLIGNAASVTLNPIGDVDYELVAWIGGCSNTDQISLTELAASPAYAVGDTSVCSGNPTQLNVVGGLNSTFSWTPATGLDNPSIQNPMASPTVSTVYTVTVTNTSGCVKTDSVSVLINASPMVDFVVADVCLNEISQFVNLTTILFGSVQSYNWSLGDGLTDNVSNPSHIYGADNIYSVKLVAVSAQGCADSSEQMTTVHPLPVADFNFSNDCEDKMIPFVDNSSVTSGSISSWSWEFDSISTSDLQNPIALQFPNDGLFTVQLNVVSYFGCTDSIMQILEVFPVPIAAFTFDSVCMNLTNQFTDLSDPNGLYPITNWNWTFSDGQISTLSDPNMGFAQHGMYTATLLMTNSAGCQNELTDGDAVVYPLPVADFNDQIKNCLNDSTIFIDLSSVPDVLNDLIVDWTWLFGDGDGSTDQHTGHTYSDHGFYPVQLTTVTDKGCTNSVSLNVEIFPLPEVGLIADETEGCQPFQVQFTDLTTIPSPYSLLSWEWNVGDVDGMMNTQHPINIYNSDTLADPNVGIYTVSLLVTSANGCVSTDTIFNYITEYPKPDALFSVDPELTDVLSPRIEFTDRSTLNVVEWFWNFGDGSYGEQQHPVHSYPNVGEYDITQIVTTQYFCTDTIGYQIKVEPIFTFYIPNAFSPNDDGYNDSFFGTGESISSYSMYVYDRWGELIFTSNDKDHHWDGTYKDKQVEQGTYVYFFKISDWKGGNHDYRGRITLMR